MSNMFSRNEPLSMDNMCDKINKLQGEIITSDRKIKDLTAKKNELRDLLESSLKTVDKLQISLSKLQVEECEWRQREKEVNGDIERLFTGMKNTEKVTTATHQQEKEESEQIEKRVSSFEQDCHDLVRKLKRLFPGGKEDSGTEIQQLEEEIRNLEGEISRVQEDVHRSLPFEEMKQLLAMVNKPECLINL